MEIVAANYQNINAKRHETRKHLFSRLSLAKAAVDGDLYKTWSIAELSRIATLSEYHFIRKFQEAFGLSPYQYQLNKKLEMAVDLLLNSQITVVQITQTVGFSDLQSFGKAFKKRYGAYPTKFREASGNRQVAGKATA